LTEIAVSLVRVTSKHGANAPEKAFANAEEHLKLTNETRKYLLDVLVVSRNGWTSQHVKQIYKSIGDKRTDKFFEVRRIFA